MKNADYPSPITSFDQVVEALAEVIHIAQQSDQGSLAVAELQMRMAQFEKLAGRTFGHLQTSSAFVQLWAALYGFPSD